MRSREMLLRRYLRRRRIELWQYRLWTGDGLEPVERFFEANPSWTVGQWKRLVRENEAHIRNLSQV